MEDNNIKYQKAKLILFIQILGLVAWLSPALFGTLLSAVVLVGIFGIIGLIFSGYTLLKLINVALIRQNIIDD